MGSREHRVPAIEPNWNDEKDVLVKDVRDGICIPAVVLSAVMEEQVLEESKLADRVISGSGSLLAF